MFRFNNRVAADSFPGPPEGPGDRRVPSVQVTPVLLFCAVWVEEAGSSGDHHRMTDNDTTWKFASRVPF